MKGLYIFIIIMIFSNFLGCNKEIYSSTEETTEINIDLIASNISQGFNITYEKREKEFLINKYSNLTPLDWGQNMTGIISNIPSNEKILYLTFDACGSNAGNQLDKHLINFLISENIAATLFINERWIDSNLEEFKNLGKNPLFQIENHGTSHKPLSVNGKSAYGIPGTKTLSEVYDEVNINAKKIESITGRKPEFFRTGTAFYDDVAVKMVNDMGYKVAGYNVLGDAGATFNKTQIINQFKNLQGGSIFLFHMNHPESQTFEGLQAILPKLKTEGWQFKKLSDD